MKFKTIIIFTVLLSFIFSINIFTQFNSKEPVDLYLYNLTGILTITSPVALDDTVINTSSTAAVTLGDVVTFYEYDRFYQSLIVAKTADTITVATPIDFAYTASALVEFGKWNMNLDGSVTPLKFAIKAPPKATFNIHTINVSILDNADMADDFFGGIAALTNGIYFRMSNGIKKNLAVIVNNVGFYEIGFSIEYVDKTGGGLYALRGRRDIPKINGVMVKLKGIDIDELQVFIQDNLTALNSFSITVDGYVN